MVSDGRRQSAYRAIYVDALRRRHPHDVAEDACRQQSNRLQ